MPLHDVSLVEGGLSALSVPLCLKAHFCQAEIYNLRGHVSKNGKADSILTKLSFSEDGCTERQKPTAL
ncbi:hypothetical protein QG34_24555 [Salmonella enterica subsp. enterica serovar Kentucky]|nr:hypothetical protein [Salmonella enterica subsp. enterica serovar Kentucky]